MKIKIGIFIAVGIGIALLVGAFLSTSDNENVRNQPVFHVTLADPNLYENGIYTDKFNVERGSYIFHFVPNGDSPKILTINLDGKDFLFLENFKLNGTLHQTGISEYYIWEYEGKKEIEIDEGKELEISINPNGEILGPVSVSIREI